MLRPATPLSVLLFAAFALLLLSVLSTPIIKAIPLGSFQGVNFGVFGYCTPDSCSGIEIGYDTASLFGEQADFDLPSSTRNSLSSILIVHPVAAFLTLVFFILAVVAHLHVPSHSARYLLLVFIFSFVDFLVCLLAFLIDVLLFIPHLTWGSYIVLAATILVGLGGLVSCAMRRTVVGRKARQKRIAENAEMSGENYYNREAQNKAAAAARQPTMPIMSSASAAGDGLPAFASYESPKKEDQVSDERIPLTARSPSERSPNHIPADMARDGSAFNAPRRSPSAPPSQVDQYGNPVGPQDAYGMRRGPSFERMNQRGRGGSPPGSYRGRGGYGRGGHNGYSTPPNGRGGYGPPGRGGYGPPGGRGYGTPRGMYGAGAGMRGGRPSPPGYQGSYDRRPSPNPPYGPYGSQQPREMQGYGTDPSINQSVPSLSTGSYDAYNPERGSLPRAESPPPLPNGQDPPPPGQAVEMDAASPAKPPSGIPQLRDSDADVAGMIGLQQARSSSAPRNEAYMSDSSKYSAEEQYVPPRAGWNQGTGGSSPTIPSPLHISRPAEVPGRNTPQNAADTGNYYEDVDPRFAPTSRSPAAGQAPPLRGETSYEDMHAAGGARSPAESDRSNYTSISQRGVNPRWNPPPPMPGYQGQPSRRPIPQRQDVLLNNNPDFQLPVNRGASPGRGAPGAGPGGAYPPASLR